MLVSLAALMAFAFMSALGRWQLMRAWQKEAQYAAMQARAVLPPLDGTALAGSDAAALLHHRVMLQGTWLPQWTVYLDNRQLDGRQGFLVVTPLQLQGGPAVAVQRGWIARNFEDRTRLAPIETPAGVVRLEGRIAPPPPRLLELAGTRVEPGFSRIRQNLELAAYGAQIHVPLLSAVSVLQTGADGEGMRRAYIPADSGAARNYGYAFQWFALAGLIAFLYVWFQFVRRPRRLRGTIA
ncbi:MAG TPA: SURF1 family protein [Burkholderiaceae bacterium]